MPRFEDVRFIQGKGRYTDDLAPRDALWAVVVRSPHAHARFQIADKAAAGAVPGVVMILTAQDYEADGLNAICHVANSPSMYDTSRPWFEPSEDCRVVEFCQPPLAGNCVRFVGEAVAVIIAITRESARDAADLLEVDYQPLPVVTDGKEALTGDAPQLWTDAPDNLALLARSGNAEAVEAALAGAALVIERSFKNQRLVCCQMEPRAAFATYDNTEGYTIVAGGQGVVRQRSCAANALDEPPDRVRLISPDVGGGFGSRTPLGMEPVLCAWAAKRTGRPVRWLGERTEAFLTDFQGRDQWTDATIGFDREGRIVALRSIQTFNLGAYPASFAPIGNGQFIVTTAYLVPNAFVEVKGALTNTTPVVPYRGAGRPEAHFAIERILDMAASVLGIDRIEIRRRNLVPKSAMPYHSPAGLVLESGDFRHNLDTVLALSDWSGFPGRRAGSEARGRLRGRGCAMYVESPVGAPVEAVELIVDPDGYIDVISGTQSTGQGHETTFVQLASALLDVPHEAVRLRTGDTLFVKQGGGSHSDRSARLMGVLLDKACPALIERAREAAAILLETDRDTLDYGRGTFRIVGGRQIDFWEIAAAFAAGRLPTQFGTALSVSETISKRIPAQPTGCAVCEIEIDPDTGLVEVVAYTTVDDVGQPINTLIVDGQVHGGIAQGVGQALYENQAIDSGSGQVLSASFMDYAVPKADNLPSFTVALTEDPTTIPDNVHRIKGGGEGGITPSLAVVINAVVDALSPFGVDHVEMPASPARIWQLIHDWRASAKRAEEK